MAAERNEKRELGEINKRNFLYVFPPSPPNPTGNWRPGTIKLCSVFGCHQLFFSFERGKKAMTKRRKKGGDYTHGRSKRSAVRKLPRWSFRGNWGRERERERERRGKRRKIRDPSAKSRVGGLQSIRLPRREIGRTAECIGRRFRKNTGKKEN